MAPSTVDLFVLTFNCAKHLINVTVFATHLLAALKQREAGSQLPDVVVFSLQEIAPMSYSFIGGYFINPYISRFEEALNLAASRFLDPTAVVASDQDDDEERPMLETTTTTTTGQEGAARQPPTYTLMRARNVGMTAVLMFARDPGAVRSIEEAEVGFGAAEMGNKGAVALRVLYEVPGHDGDEGTTEMTFVATHLAAMEWNLPRRNANWAAIMRGLTFEDPEQILRPKKKALPGTENGEGAADGDISGGDGDAALSPGSRGRAEEAVRLLHDQHLEESLRLQEKLQDISVFKPSSHLFVAGDLNYRISTTSPPPMADFPSLDPESEHHYRHYFALDQLTRERLAGRTLHGMSEANVEFPPTYKYVVLPAQDDGGKEQKQGEAKDDDDDDDDLEVPWRFASHRYPGWTDRILYTDVPPWAKARPRPEGEDGEAQKDAKNKKQTKQTEPSPPLDMVVRTYDALPLLATSDHRPVFLRVDVPVVARSLMAPPAREAEMPSWWQAEWDQDPRITLPVAVDPEAWGRREAGRRKEVVTGWSMFLWSTKQGAVLLSALMVVGLGSWYLWQSL